MSKPEVTFKYSKIQREGSTDYYCPARFFKVDLFAYYFYNLRFPEQREFIALLKYVIERMNRQNLATSAELTACYMRMETLECDLKDRIIHRVVHFPHSNEYNYDKVNAGLKKAHITLIPLLFVLSIVANAYLKDTIPASQENPEKYKWMVGLWVLTNLVRELESTETPNVIPA
jgi:hypothetical protein